MPRRRHTLLGRLVLYLGWMGVGLLAACQVRASPRVFYLPPATLQSGCGCSFHVPAQAGARGQAVLQWLQGHPALMRIDQRLVRLQPLPAQGVPEVDQAPGTKRTYTLTAPGIRVTADCTALQSCAGGAPGCEAASYRVRLSVVSAQGRRVLPAWGSCGC